MFLPLASAPWLLEHVAKRRKQSLFLQIILELLPNVLSIHPAMEPFLSLLVHLCPVLSAGRSRSLAISILLQAADSISPASWAISVCKTLMTSETSHAHSPPFMLTLVPSSSYSLPLTLCPLNSTCCLCTNHLKVFCSPRTTKKEERGGSWWDVAASSFNNNVTSLGYWRAAFAKKLSLWLQDSFKPLSGSKFTILKVPTVFTISVDILKGSV